MSKSKACNPKNKKDWKKSDFKKDAKYNDMGEGTNSKYWNDPSWLDRNPELTRGAGNLGFYSRLGISYGVGNLDNLSSSTTTYKLTGSIQEPTLLTFYYAPTIGVSKDRSSPINIVGQQLMSTIRAEISGRRTYQASDLIMHIVKLSSVLQMIALGTRAYSFARHYDAYDLKSPNQYLAAMGFDPDSVLYDLDRFYNRLVEYHLSMARFHIPSFMPIIDRQVSMCNSIFKVTDDVKATKFMYVPKFYYRYVPASASSDPRLATEKWYEYGQVKTVDQYCDIVEELIRSITDNEDFWTIQGDFDKAFEGKFYQMSIPSRDSILAPIYDANISSQMENLRLFQAPLQSTFDITQDPKQDIVKQDPHVTTHGVASMADPILNFHWRDVTPLNVLYACHYLNVPAANVGGGGPAHNFEVRFDQCSSEILVGCNMYYGDSDAVDGMHMLTDIAVTDNSEIASWIGMLSLWSQLQYKPLVRLWKTTVSTVTNPNDTTTTELLGVFGDLDNWRRCTRSEIEEIHRVSMFSLWGIDYNQ